ncbi:phage antirepressor KilAC domain-containing protein [Staphylococcus pseudoxylosus]|uniref:phage antirepressor KilAC domain-containing protein n=1 Tax=Staphylococcus pseudoxylosus TaxID=2282419 RepID=UPI000D1E3791|nr:phage regulatory protein/antirepressor Ant [Staphylococcus pseudoxylosus]MBM2657586.1 phage antirepressor KilAC domain-containing protein [Staphylococcus pseudoxylosus]MEB5782430.1 phage regulatory protein/antirepressor Ant [Staphylococcus pseudoxylosus]PTI83660.1 Rha family transcriptional regulator [Staphylococcus xylosus]
MQSIQTIEIENKEDVGLVVSSRTVAEELNKNHKDILRDLDNILESHGADLSCEILASEYKNTRGRKYREYLLTKDGFTLYMFNIQGHNDFKMAYINRFNEMEQHIKQQPQIKDSYMIDDPVERAKRWIEEEQQREQLTVENETLKPKASYYDLVLRSKSLLSVTEIAKDYGMGAKKFNNLLHDLGIQYRLGKVWHLYAKHQDKGYTHSATFVIDEEKSKITTKWTQTGRIFLYEILKENGIFPTMEKEELK